MNSARGTLRALSTHVNSTWISGLRLFAGFCLLVPETKADIFVPTDYPTIQAAIDAAIPGDVVHLAPGKYPEVLHLNKSLTLAGSGTNNCVLNFFTNVPIISITGPGTVVLSNFEIEGGLYMGTNLDYYNGFSDLGIVASNANLVLDTMLLNQIKNYCVTVVDGSIAATNVGLWTRNVLGAADVGFQLKGCTGTISRVWQESGHLDHTVNINNPPANHSDVTIENCRIRTSSGSYGNCIRSYLNANVVITNCFLYRAAGEAFPAYPAFNHSAISVNGYSNVVIVSGNTISNSPWAIYCYGSFGGNRLLVENNLILNSSIGGIVWDAMSYKGVDLGGGAFGSRGGNVFSELPAPLTNFCTDVLFTNGSGFSSANIFALRNTWSNPTNRESVIYDKLDNALCGRLITDELVIKTTGQDLNGRPVISWNERGAGERYTVELRPDLTAGNWINAPGSWPITNSGLSDMVWTNSTVISSNAFFRIRSLVP